MKKGVAYILAIVGLALLALSNILANISIPKLLTNILGGILIVIGVTMMAKSEKKSKAQTKSKEPKDLPVYEGEDIVAYRRK